MILDFFDKDLKNTTIDICKTINQCGGTAYLVGGCVRDGLMKNKVSDADIEVYGIKPEKLKKILQQTYRVDLVGKSYLVFKIQKYNIDVSIPRNETKIDKGHKAFLIETNPNLKIKEATNRRDFTINTILFNPLTNQIIDYYNGIKDIENKLIRHVSKKFSEDPLRVLRAMQFISRFNFKVDEETTTLCSKLDQKELATERIFDEWKKMFLQGINISKGLNFLKKINWVKYYPQLKSLINCPQDPTWHPEGDVWVHTGLCLDAYANFRETYGFDEKEKLMIGFSVLCHDLGKPATTYYQDNHIRSPGHEIKGVPIAEKFLRLLTNNADLIANCKAMVRHHMQPYALYKNQSSEAAVRRLSSKVKRIDWLLAVSKADYLGCNRSFSDETPHINWLKEKADKLGVIKSALKPIVMGRHLKAKGIDPGVIYKTILTRCYNDQIKGKFSDLQGGLKRLEMILSHNRIKFKK